MAEGLLGGVLGEDEDRPETDASQRAATADAFAAAVAARLSASDSEVARETSAFLKDQSRLVRIQASHLDEEHGLRMAHLRSQLREESIRRFVLRLRVGFQLFLVLIAAVIGGGLLLMLHDAFASRSVVVHPFETPPALVDRGVSGKMVAGGILDELVRLQDATRADAAKRSLSNAWSNEIKLDIPETGFTLGELSRLLRARFGHDVHIEGDLVQTEGGGFELSVRGDGVRPKRLRAPAEEFDQLLARSAEYIYSQAEPVLWAYYLIDAGRIDEAAAFSRGAYASSSTDDRPYLLNTWANALLSAGKTPEGLALYRQALRLKPDYWNAYNNVMESLRISGDEEGAWRTGKQMQAVAGGRPGRAPEVDYEELDQLTKNLTAWHEAVVADADSNGGVGADTLAAGIEIALTEIELHNPPAAELALQTIRADTAEDPVVAAGSHYIRGRIALETGDAARAAEEMERFDAVSNDPNVKANTTAYDCWLAPAEEAAHRPDKADAALARGGRYVDCARFRGDILDGRGDWRGAQRAYADAVKLAPDLPAGYLSWGLALARHGDLDGAAARFKDANLRGPAWADPLKAWGDVLERQGRGKEAREKYAQALTHAPNWAALRSAAGQR